MRSNTFKAVLGKTGLAATLLLSLSGAALAQSVSLTAAPTHAALPDGQVVPMWGYTCSNTGTAGATCSALNPNAGSNWSPVVITVPAGPLTITLTNNLTFPIPAGGSNSVPTSLVIVGQLGGGLGGTPTRTVSPTHAPQGTTWPGTKGDPDPVNCGGDSGTFCPPAQSDRVQSFATEVASGATTALSWPDLRPGTYLIESGTHPSIQGPMGLYGVLVVTTAPSGSTPGQAYPGVSYDADLPLLLSEIDPVQNATVALAVATAGFSETRVWNGQASDPTNCGLPSVHSCYPPAVNYDPRYYLINGVSFDRSSQSKSQFNVAAPASTGQVLVRFVNAGLRMHVPSIVGAQTGNPAVSGVSLIAEDGNVLPGSRRVQNDVFLAAGKTYDVLINAPATGASALPVFDRQLSLSTNNQRDGGMQAYISVNGSSLPGAVASVSVASETYFCVSGSTLAVTDPGKGVLANDSGANGATLGAVSLLGGADSLAFQSNGTFTYTPPAAGPCGGTFAYSVNGSSTATATIQQCDATVHAAGCSLGAAPSAVADTYASRVATRLPVSSPGVLLNDTDPSGLPLTAVLSACVATPGYTCLTPAQVTLHSDGSFTAVPPGPGNYMFSYQAVNSQKTASAAASVSIIAPTPTGLVVNVRDAKNGAAINDYRWIIEEDRTFYIDPRCQVNSTDPLVRPASCPPLPIQSLATNFHTSSMPVVATGCTGPVSCESGQTLGGTPAVCDVGDGACRTDEAQKTAISPSQVALDPLKRYYISILPGDGVNPVIGGAGGPVEDASVTGGLRKFDVAKDCGPYSLGDPRWVPGGEGALCGHGMGGAQIAAGQTTVNVNLQATPFPTAKIAVFVFEDDFPLNGENDAGGGVDVLAPNEPGLGGFELKLLDQAGGFGDSTGQITYDMFNMPVSNALAGTIDPTTGVDACPITQKSDGLVGMIPTCPRLEADGTTLSPLAGQAVIDNLYPGLYEVVATPAADRIARGEEWLQTNTLDGTKAIEAFIKAGEPGYFQEFGPGGYHVSIGFANPKMINDRKAATCANQACNASIDGQVTTTRMSRTPDQRVYSSETYDSFSFTQCYVSLGDPDGGDFAFTKCNADGTFTFAGVPSGNYRLTVFDQWNDILVDGLSTGVHVSGATSIEIPMTQWRTNLYTRTFIDTSSDGVSQPEEPGLPLVSTNVRYRDGSFGFFNNTDLDGYAGFNEVFPFLNWLVVETDSTRYKPAGVHVVNDAGGPADGSTDAANAGGGNSDIAAHLANTVESPTAHVPALLRIPGAKYCASADCPSGDPSFSPASGSAGSTGRIDPPSVTTEGWQGLLGQNGFLEFAMKQFAAGENGGIKGHVIYASTRPFDDPALSLQLSWEPGVPNVTINLYQIGTAPDGTRSLKLVDTTTTTSWDDWAQGFRTDANGNPLTDGSGNAVPNMSCPGQEETSPFYFNVQNTRQWLSPGTPLAANSRFKCYDGWPMLNQLQPAPYDGLYKFPSITARNPNTGAPTLTNCRACVPNPVDGTPMLPAGKYVVEVVLPPGYELVKEEDKNILLGDVYIAPVTQQFAGLGNIFILPDQAAINAYYNPNNPGALNATTNLGATPRHEGDTGSVETFWPCVGATRIVPDLNSLFPGAGQAAPFAGASRPLCDRKEVTLEEQMTALAKFYVFTSTHVAGHFTGMITNDFASEFDPFSPAFGEKFSVPNVPVSFKDFNGNEVARVYSDQWGIFNGLNYSSYAVNPPNPTGYIPQMMIACMNDPGPIPDPDHPGQTMTDPMFNPAYSNFCYETPFMPGQTQYMDTPVLPNSAFAAGYNLPDCEYPDATPAIKSVLGTVIGGSGGGDRRGPWVSAAGQTLTINALGDKTVLNHAYSGPQAASSPFNKKFITRHYGFGSRCTSVGSPGCTALSSVTIGGVNAPITSWTDSTITVTVPALTAAQSSCTIAQRGVTGSQATNYRCGQLVITAGNGKQSIDAVTVTIAGKPPTFVNGENGEHTALQTAVNNATPGDLIIVGPGTYKEMLLMWKPVRLQGVGAASVTINADAHPAGVLDPWRRQVNCLFGLALNGQPISATNDYDPSHAYACPANMRQRVDRIPFETILGWDTTANGNLAQLLQEPTLMGAYEGAGITVLGRGVRIPGGSSDFFGTGVEGGFPDGSTYLTSSNADCAASTTATNGRDYGTSNFLCNPSRIDGITITNSSQGGGAIFLHGWTHSMEVANSRIISNTGTLSGGITIGSGEFPDPYIAGSDVAPPFPVSGGTPAGTQLGYGFNKNVRVHHNAVTSNASIGDELYSATPTAAGGVTFCTGADNYHFNYNWVCGNLSAGDGAGVAHAGFSYNGDISHNQILFNQSANPTIPTHGGGIGILGASPDRTLPDGTECGSVNDQDCPPGLSEGTGPGLVIDSNLIVGNSAESGSGGGIRLQAVNGQDVGAFPLLPNRWYEVNITNNIISNNVAGWDGGGVSMQDALKVNFINNTVVSNDSTASAGVLFNTLGAPMASVPPPGCAPTTDPTQPQNPNCINPVTTSTNQAAGLVTMENTSNLTASLPGIVICPIGHSSGLGALLPIPNGDCREISYPLIRNDLFWQNRAFHIEVGGFGEGERSQQHVVTLVPSLNQTATGLCVPTGTDNGAPGSAGPVNYWDIGVRGDASPTPNSGSGFRLEPRFSILTNAAAYPAMNNLGADPAVVSKYCNGSRLPPENGGHGYQAPPGASETTSLPTVFMLNQITPAATVDEGNNWINLSYGPLSLANAATAPVSGTAQAPLGNYSITPGSPAANAASATAAPNHDFFGTSRPQSGGFDIGAVELVVPPTAVANVTPASLAFGTWATGTTSSAQTLTLRNTGGTNLTGINVAVTAPFSRPSGAAGGTCGTTLTPAAGTCTINVIYTPSAVGAASGSVTITASVPVTGSPVSLSGSGVAARATVAVTPNPLTITLPSGAGNLTGTGTVTLTNTAPAGGANMTVNGVSFTGGSVLTYFFNAVSGQDLCTGTTLQPGQTCTVGVRFTNVLSPRGVNRNGTIVFTDNAAPTPSQSGALVGFATP